MGLAMLNTEAVEIQCGECGIIFSVPKHWQEQRRENGKSFYCPNGHCRAYVESEVQKLAKALAAERQRREWSEANERAARAAKEKAEAKTARLQRRIKAGVCPLCKRSFVQLRRHMECKHPDSA